MPTPAAVTAPPRSVAANGLDAKLAFLCAPGHYPEPTSSVEAVETHMSWVFLTDDFAYKLKKAVRNADVDLRTLAARKSNCVGEVRLNRRFTRDVYLGVVALGRDAAGALAFGAGETVDWLVKMRRLPDERMLDRLIGRGSVCGADVEAIVARLCDVYRKSPPLGVLADEYRRQFVENIAANQLELCHPRCGDARLVADETCAEQLAFIGAHGDLLDGRVQAGRIVEGHGDLRPEHVCVEREPQIIDCLEFSRVLRTLDTADELGYLALECERLGAPQLRARILEAYRHHCADAPPDALVHFYQSHRACVRATLAIRHLSEPPLADAAQWRARAAHYLSLARAHAVRCEMRS